MNEAAQGERSVTQTDGFAKVVVEGSSTVPSFEAYVGASLAGHREAREGRDSAARPTRPTPTRAVVVAHEILGLQPEIGRVVARFEKAGFAAIAPDLLAGGNVVACIVRLIRASATGEGVPAAIILRAREWLSQATGLGEGSIGLVGFCVSGAFVLTIGKGWPAVSTNYGDVPPREKLAGLGPTVGCYGGRDRIFGKGGERLRSSLESLGIPVDVHTYPHAGHSFLTDGHHPVARLATWPAFHVDYDATTAEDAWSKILAFLTKHVPAG